MKNGTKCRISKKTIPTLLVWKNTSGYMTNPGTVTQLTVTGIPDVVVAGILTIRSQHAVKAAACTIVTGRTEG